MCWVFERVKLRGNRREFVTRTGCETDCFAILARNTLPHPALAIYLRVPPHVNIGLRQSMPAARVCVQSVGFIYPRLFCGRRLARARSESFSRRGKLAHAFSDFINDTWRSLPAARTGRFFSSRSKRDERYYTVHNGSHTRLSLVIGNELPSARRHRRKSPARLLLDVFYRSHFRENFAEFARGIGG